MTHNCDASTILQAAHAGLTVEWLSDASGALPYANAAGAVSAEEMHRVFAVVFHSRFAAVTTTPQWIAAVHAGAPLRRDSIFASNQRARGLAALEWTPWEPAAVERFRPEVLVHCATAYGRGGEPYEEIEAANKKVGKTEGRIAEFEPYPFYLTAWEEDKYIVGQHEAKRNVAIALRNRWRRMSVTSEIRNEIIPNNILMIGATGVGKTARCNGPLFSDSGITASCRHFSARTRR